MLYLNKRKNTDEKRREYWLLAFGMLQASVEDQLTVFVSSLVNGWFTPNQMGAAAIHTLTPAHATAYTFGASFQGYSIPQYQTQAYIDRVMDEQEDFMVGFVDALDNHDTRYIKSLEQLYPDLGTEEEILARVASGDLHLPPAVGSDEYWDEKAINHRMQLYAERLRGTANWAAIDTLDVTDEIRWKDVKDKSECEVCAERGMTIWLKDTLPGVPGDGSTPCGVRCRCELELLDGTVIHF